jgi:Glycosyltransferase family 87
MPSRRIIALIVEVVLAAGALFAGLAFLAPKPQTGGEDLVQDYLSARALLSGEDPYQPLPPLRERAGLTAGPQFEMKAEYNPHPPVAVFLAAPVAGLPFDRAYQVHRVLQIILLAGSWVWACQLAGIRNSVVIVAGAAALGLWPPVWGGLDWGQPTGMLALLSVALWHLADGRQPALAGGVLVISCLVRPFFAGYAAAAGGWRWRDVAEAVSVALGVVLASFFVVNITPWEWYRRASVAGEFAATGGSLPSVLDLPAGAGVVGFVLWIVAVAIMVRRGLPGRATAALGTTGGMLVYPLAWFRYDVVLLPIAVWAGCEGFRRGRAVAVVAVAAYVVLRFVPPYAHIPGSTTWIPVAGRTCLLAACILLAVIGAATRRPEPPSVPE